MHGCDRKSMGYSAAWERGEVQQSGQERTGAGADAAGVGGAWLSAMPASHIKLACRRCWYFTASSTRPEFMHSKMVLMRLSLSSRYCT